MQWDRLFEDLEGQLASEWEAERAALDAEAERLRISRIDLRTRLVSLAARRHPILLDLGDGERQTLTVHDIGADWVATSPGQGDALTIIPLTAILAIGIDHGALLDSLDGEAPAPALRGRMTLGFVLRDLARRRMPVMLAGVRSEPVHGTIDRAGVDHLDIALHEPGQPRRASAVQGFRMVPFTAVRWIRIAGSG